MYPHKKKKPRKIFSFRAFLVVLPRFELRQTEPKTVVLPLHHRTNSLCFLLKSGAKIEICKQTSKYFVHFFIFYRVNRALLLCNQQIIVLFTALNKQIFLVKQVGSRNYLIKGRQLLLIQRNATALNQLTHFTFRRKYGRIINE